MKHFHLIVNGYRYANIAMICASKEDLFFCIITHLNSLPQVRKEQIQ